jgi:hypothetical protein
VFGDDYRVAMVAAHVARTLRFVDTDVQRAFVESEESRKLLEEILGRDTSTGSRSTRGRGSHRHSVVHGMIPGREPTRTEIKDPP